MEDQSYTDALLHQQLEEQQHLQRQAIHPSPSPSPVPYSPGPHLPPSSNGHYAHHSHHNARRHNSANVSQVSDTLRRRSTGVQGVEEASVSSDVDASFRLSFSGLDMPSTNDDPLDDATAYGNNNNNNNGNDHLLPHNYYHANAGIHHNVNANVYSSAHTHHRLHQSLNNVTMTANANRSGSPRHNNNPPKQQRQHAPRLQRAHTHSHAQAHRPHRQHRYTEDDTVSVVSSTSASSVRRPRRSSLTPQHQLDRKNSRRRITDATTTNSASTTTSSASAVPNRYYLAGKSVQTEWSSPTRQRRSRSTLNSHRSNGKPKSKSSLGGDRDNHNHDNTSNPHQHGSNSHIIVLPSISIPNGNHDEYRHSAHPSQIKPPAFPQRRACVQATSMVCSFGTFKWCVIIQIILVIPLCLYVFDAHAQKKHAKQQLQQYNEEHEHILNQMMWMDQAAKKLKAHHHKHNSRNDHQKYYDGGGGGADADPNNSEYLDGENVNPLDLVLAGNNQNNNKNNPNNFFESYYADNSATEDLRDSVHKLRGQMRDMQYRIQQNSKARITEKYGEGPIRVYIHPEPEDPVLAAAAAGPAGTPQEMTSEIAMELFIEDTPHAVSTFLYQIERGHWNRVQMNWKSETSILSKPGGSVTSGMGDWMQTSRLEFLEQFPIKHCEVALVQQGQMGVLSLQINLVEVPFQEQEEVCIGRLMNDRLILPKARGYFMAEFTTTSTAKAGANANLMQQQGQQAAPQQQQQQQQQQHQEQQQGQQLLEQEAPQVEMTPPAHEPPPPIVDNEEEGFRVQEETERDESSPRQPRLRGRADSAAEEEEEVDVGHQIVPPLEEPQDVPGEGY